MIFGLVVFFSTLTAHSATVTTPDMGLELPVPGTVSGPGWATMLNQAFTDIDSHDHTNGNGALIPTAAININADLQCHNFNLVLPRSTMYINNSSTLSNSSDTNNVYVYNGNLYFNNASGTPIQITTGSSVNVGGSGSISGMGSTTASVTYSDITKTFSFTQNSGVTANVGLGALSLFENVPSAASVTLKSPTSLGSSYSLTMPSALPASTKIATISSSGQIGDSYDVDGSTLTVSGNTLSVRDRGIVYGKIALGSVTSNEIASGTIVGANIAGGTITTGQIAGGGVHEANLDNSSVSTRTIQAQSVTQDKLPIKVAGLVAGIGGFSISNSSGAFSTTSTASFVTVTNQTAIITTTGRPVFVGIQSDGSGSTSNLSDGSWRFLRDGSVAYTYNISSAIIPGNLNAIDLVAAGTHTYVFQGLTGTGTSYANNIRIVAYEL